MILRLSVFLFFIFHLTFSEEEPRGYTCDQAQTTSSTFNSVFSANLSAALAALLNDTASTGFNTTTVTITERSTNSSSPVKYSVTALALCRGSLSPSDCQSCIDDAVLSIRRVCPNRTAAQVWHTYCMIRYSVNNFINETETDVSFSLFDVRDVPDASGYDETANLLMRNLSVAAGRSDGRYAVARTNVSITGITVYGYVDCTRDVAAESCTKCLLSITDSVSNCCLGKWAVWLASPTCSIQFNMDPVHKDWETAPYIRTTVAAPLPTPEVEMVAAPPPPTPPPYVGGSDGDRSGGGRRKLTVSIEIVLGVFGCMVAGCLVGAAAVIIVMKRRRLRGKNKKKKEEIKEDDFELKSCLFEMEVLIAATDNFSDEYMLGRGGFGSVYKGKTSEGQEIAVKKLAADSLQGNMEFANEVKFLLKMQHRNLVQLLGCCVQDTERILVYEYLPNKSLDKYLFDKSKSEILDWQKRMDIIMGVARGLLYLHQDSALTIVHRDIKASNILLDARMNPKISDFGLARLFTDEKSYYRTRQIVGTFGYMAPEYAFRGLLSLKSDVFSFGVLMLEIISGRKNFDLQFDSESQELLKLVWRLAQERRLMELVDVTIGSFPEETVQRCLKIALLCAQDNPQDRPTMSSVLLLLSNDSAAIPEAGRPAYQAEYIEHRIPNSGDKISTSSGGNSITITLTSGR